MAENGDRVTPPALSINLNKIALLRNSRGRDLPNLLHYVDCVLHAGADGITLHPRLDQRHVRVEDVRSVAAHLSAHWPSVELNIECEDHADLIELIVAVHPAQCTLVPVSVGEITSDHGWDLPRQSNRLARAASWLVEAGVRVSAFADCDATSMDRFAQTGIQRVELYTGPYAWAWGTSTQATEVTSIFATAKAAVAAGLSVNAGHDLDRYNVAGLRDLPGLRELSIGHAVACRALEVGYAQAVSELKAALRPPPTPQP